MSFLDELSALYGDDEEDQDLELAQKKQAADRQKLVDNVQDTDSSILGNLFAGISGFGAGIAKRDVGQAFNQAKAIQMAGPNRALAEFDKAREQGLETEDRNLQRTRLSKEDARADKKEGREDAAHAAAQQLAKDKLDPNSRISKTAQRIMATYRPEMSQEELSKLTAADVEALGPAVKFKIENDYKRETEKAKRDQHKEDMDQRSKDRELDRQDRAAARAAAAADRAEARAQRKEEYLQRRQDRIDAATDKVEAAAIKAAALNPKQIQEIDEFDEQIQSLKEIDDQLGENSGWTGPLDSRVPNLLTFGTEQTEWRTNVGKVKAAFNKFISGATISDKEREILAPLTPDPSDDYKTFKAKMASAQKQLARNKAIHLQNLKRAKKDVGEYEQVVNPAASTNAPPIVEQRTLKDGTVVNVVKQPDGTYKKVE